MKEIQMHEVALLINDVRRASATGAVFERRNPLTGASVTRAAAATVADVDAACRAADAAFSGWAETGPNVRRTYLLAASERLAAKADAFVEAMKAETGATESWARFNVRLAADMLREAAALTTQVTGDTIPSDKPGCLAMAIRRPAGVCVGIAPWNAPVILGARAIATALACGNSVILKSSEICPLTHALIGEALTEAGFPAGVVNILSNAPEDAADIVNALIDHPAVRRINFTGSTRVGRLIAERAGRRLKPVLLELGGKAPLLVLKDADLDEAVKAAAFGAFFNQGQICMSTERIIVEESVADAFVERFAAKAASLIAGDPNAGTAPLGSVIGRETVSTVTALMEDAIGKGARLVAGAAPEGLLIDAMVLDHVTADMRIYSEESFGPIVAIIRAKDMDDAVRIANDSDYGLSASVFSRDISTAMSVAGRIDSGICHINGPTVHDEAQMPFGGVKASGFGRFGGQAGIAEFTDLRWMTIETRAGHYPI
ncbi:Salicylaldehyde dehydrogenase [Sphingobium chlorophenolicum L-1]|uniref:Salicylaldehyde dehydrogenase n=2 Tax=Sphingobium chlorophenolicum TaxID=46429 RepID=F6F1R6_SPHCR|nr:Salicylaldehyde dehydrogenase [Sphingobium chlorophenolicum L-1]